MPLADSGWSPSVGINLAGITDWSTEHPFIDRFKTSRDWIASSAQQWNTGIEVAVDAHGWPVAIPDGATRLIKPMAVDPQSEWPSGRYVVLYTGSGTVSYTLGTQKIASESSHGRDIVVVDNPSASDMQTLYVSITSTEADDPIRDIHVIREDQLAAHEAGEIFNPAFLDKLDDMRALRFMDWMKTNNSAIREWSDFASFEDATWAANGVPLEAMVELANRTGADPWFCMPHLASDDAVRRFASYVRDRLDPGLKAHVEFSNEVWNWNFGQSQYASAAADALWAVDGNGNGTIDAAEHIGSGYVEWYGMRSAQVADIWTEVFGAEADARLDRVIGTQTGWQGREIQILNSQHWVAQGNAAPYTSMDSYAVTGYFDGGLSQAGNAATLLQWASEGEAGLAKAFRQLEFGDLLNGGVSLAELVNLYAYQANVASAHGLEMIMYESGAHLTSRHEEGLTDFFTAMQRDSRMGELFFKNMQAFAAAGGTMFNVFADVGVPSKYGFWGALESIYQDGSARWDAIETYNALNSGDWEDRDPGVFANGGFWLGTAAADSLDGGAGRDVVIGGAGDDWLGGGAGADRIDGAAGDDAIAGGSGDDTINPGTGDGTVSGGTGEDTLVLGEAWLDYMLSGDLAIVNGDGTVSVSGIETLKFANGTFTAEQAINDAPADIALSSASVRENAVPGTVVGSLTSSDADAALGDTVSYTLIDDAGGRFAILDGTIVVTGGAVLDFELATSHAITIRATDAKGLSRDEIVVISVLNRGEAPVIVSPATAVSVENSTGSVLDVEADYAGDGAVLVYAIAGGADAPLFVIDPITGELSFAAPPDFENPGDAGRDNTYDVIVSVGDGSDSTGQAIAVGVTDLSPIIADVAGDHDGVLVGTPENDTLIGGQGYDVADYSASDGAVQINLSLGRGTGGHADRDVLTGIEGAIGSALDDSLTGDGSANGLAGGEGNDTLEGGAGLDLLDGGDGGDVMRGGDGDDTYVVDSALDQAIEAAGGGTDTVQSSVSRVLGSEQENLTLTGLAAINGFGNDLANRLTGNAAANILNGLGGADIMTGGDGDDTYVVDSALDQAIEAAGGGTDTVRSSVSRTLRSELENLTLTGGDAINGFGNDLANRLTGNAAANILNGLGGADIMTGGDGDDTYVVDSALDQAIEAAGGGIDTLRSSVSRVLGSELENLTLTGGDAINGFGNDLANRLTGNAAANILNGLGGADIMTGGDGDDTYVVDSALDQAIEAAGGGIDTVRSSVARTLRSELENLTLTGGDAINGFGNDLANRLTGNTAANILNGLGGADIMTGGDGDDTYAVDSALDQAIEAADGGIDTVRSSVSRTLRSELENLTLTGADAINGFGNDLANRLTGNTAANILNGLGGADTMIGGDGNDTYAVDSVLDVVIETAGGGTDTVRSSVARALASQQENLTLTGLAAVNGFGNDLANRLTGNAAANVLNGLGGADTMSGGDGNDTYIVDNVFDQVAELLNLGTDTVRSGSSHTLAANLERLFLETGAGNITGAGNALANRVQGNEGNNIIAGKAGSDVLTGGLGTDAFLFDTTLNGANNVDTIGDFSVADDVLRLDDAVFAGLTAGGILAAGQVHIGTTATEASHRIVYNDATGALFFDADGFGGAAQTRFAWLDTGLAITNRDFMVV